MLLDFPNSVLENVAYRLRGYLESVADVFTGSRCGKKVSNFGSLLSGYFLSVIASAFGNLVSHVVHLCSYPKMIRIAASRYIAFVKHAHPFRNLSMGEYPCPLVGAVPSLASSGVPVPLVVEDSIPQPTFCPMSLIHLIPKVCRECVKKLIVRYFPKSLVMLDGVSWFVWHSAKNTAEIYASAN